MMTGEKNKKFGCCGLMRLPNL